jgi:hypothetical protein
MRTQVIIDDAKKLVDEFVNTPISFPYIDTKDGRCIGSGYMTYKSAAKCALICAKKCREEILNFDDNGKGYWDEMVAEIESLAI